MKLKCVVIDDEPLARECLEGYIGKVDFLEFDGSGANPIELGRMLRDKEIDLIFLDIQMPYINGLEFLKQMPVTQMVVLTTAYPEYALDGYQYNVLDYLVKPVAFDRFFRAASKALDHKALKSGTALKTADADFFFIKCDYKYEKIYIADILYVEAEQNYVIIQTAQKRYMTLLSMKLVEEKLSSAAFVRVHKSFLVAIDKIETLENHRIIIRGKEIPVSRHYKDEILSKVVHTSLWRKE